MGANHFEKDLDVTRTIGWFTTLFPVILSVPDKPLPFIVKSIKETLRAVPNKGIGYGILTYLGGQTENQKLRIKPDICFNYLGQFDQPHDADQIQYSPMPSGAQISPRNETPYLLNINSVIINGKFQMMFTYPEHVIDEETMNQVTTRYRENLKMLVDHCVGKDQQEWTPSDFAAKDLTFEELETVLEALKENDD